MKDNDIKYPKNENVCCLYKAKTDDVVCVLTNKPPGEFFYLYEVSSDGKLTKLGKGTSPRALEEKYKVKHKMKSPPA